MTIRRLSLGVFAAMAGTFIYIFRDEILQYSAQSIIKKNLPDYIVVDKVVFDYKKGELILKGLAVKNPPGYNEKFLASIGTLTCGYKFRGKGIFDGIEVTRISAERPAFYIERLSNGRMNVNEMGSVMSSSADEKPPAPESPVSGGKETTVGGKKFYEFFKLPDTVEFSDGSIIFNDLTMGRDGYRLVFGHANGNIRIELSPDYQIVRAVTSRGAGSVNDDQSQRIDWDIWLDPRRKSLTMSNRFVVSGIRIAQFKPYYDRYSPIDIRSGIASGTLVFNFDDGVIGSMNTIKLNDLKFYVKEDSSAAEFWRTTVPDLIKYLQSAPGEITFDFKIKGSMDSPEIYPGPIVKQAIQNMAIDKISQAIRDVSQQGQETAVEAPQTDAEKVMETIKALLQK